jgi:DNA polymerase III delta prime subunit
LFDIAPLEDKNSIGIEAIRELKTSLRLKSDKHRVVIIPHSELLTPEAHNSFLKILEEPPKDVHFFMAVTKLGDMLDTIQSRTVVWRLNLPTKDQLNIYFASKPDTQRAKAIAISESRIGLITALLDDDENHELLHAIDTAKELLGENHFERMIRVDALSKDAMQTALLLEALELVCKAALENAASKNNHTVKQWHKRLGYVTQAEDWLAGKVQAKLVLSHLFMRI